MILLHKVSNEVIQLTIATYMINLLACVDKDNYQTEKMAHVKSNPFLSKDVEEVLPQEIYYLVLVTINIPE